MYYDAFCEKLTEARKQSGYNQREIAKILKISQPCYAGWETGRTQPDLESLAKLADLYGVSLDWLLGTQGGKNG